MRSSILIVIAAIMALLAGYSIAQHSPVLVLSGVIVLAIFIVAFIKIEWGLYILIFSMLLSPEISIGETSAGSLGRGMTLRFEDFLLVIIGFSWFTKNSIHKFAITSRASLRPFRGAFFAPPSFADGRR